MAQKGNNPLKNTICSLWKCINKKFTNYLCRYFPFETETLKPRLRDEDREVSGIRVLVKFIGAIYELLMCNYIIYYVL